MKNENIRVLELNDNELEQVVGGMTTADIPHYGKIKQRYFAKGSNAAFMLFLFYHPTPFGYEVVEYIEKEIASGNRGYEINGVYYDSPESDPYFKDKRILYK